MRCPLLTLKIRTLLCYTLLSGAAINWSLAARANRQTLTQPDPGNTIEEFIPPRVRERYILQA